MGSNACRDKTLRVFTVVKTPGTDDPPVAQPVQKFVKVAVPGTPPHALTAGRIKRSRVVALFPATLKNVDGSLFC